MIIKLVSYPSWNRLSSKQRKLRISTVVEILNKKDVDFVMFSEWVFNNIEDLNSVCQLVHNEKVTALFELKLSRGLVGNQLFLLQNGKVIDLKTHQVFSEHKDATEENIEIPLFIAVPRRAASVSPSSPTPTRRSTVATPPIFFMAASPT